MFEALASFVFSLFLLLNGPSHLDRNSKTIPGEVTVKLHLLIVVQSEALKGRPLTLPTNIRLGLKGLPGTYTLAYYENP